MDVSKISQEVITLNVDNYYDLDSNRIFINGIKDLIAVKDKSNTEDMIFKKLVYPSVLEKLYLINQFGIVINTVENCSIIPVIIDGYPCINLSSKIKYNGKYSIFSRERYRIIDLVAYNFIRNSECYLERGYIAINKNGILTDNYYSNIEYVKMNGGVD